VPHVGAAARPAPTGEVVVVAATQMAKFLWIGPLRSLFDFRKRPPAGPEEGEARDIPRQT